VRLASPILLFLIGAVLVPSTTLAEEAMLSLETTQVRLFYSGSGTFSNDILDPRLVLRNVIGGEGDAAEPATSALVDVTVRSLSREAYADGSRKDSTGVVEINVVAGDAERVILHERRTIGMFNSAGLSHIGFWLSNIGCEKLTITVRIAKTMRTLSSAVPFRCAE